MVNPFGQAEMFPLGEQALIVRLCREESDTGEAAMRALAALGEKIAAEAPPGLAELVPAGFSLAIHYDPLKTDFDEWRRRIETWIGELRVSEAEGGRLVEIPVCYGGEFGPDLPDLARHAGIGEEEAVRLHSEAEYVVGMIGFAPGFPYVYGLPERLAMPRRSEPRTKVPAGSVAVGSGQTGIYPADLPGGWHVIGRTPVRLFNPGMSPPSLLAPGDRVRFVPVYEAEFRRLLHNRAGRTEGRVRPDMDKDDFPGARAAFRVRKPGLYTTLQDFGRPGFQRYGVTPGGVMDRYSYRLANRLVGNRNGEAVLEMTVTGPELEVLEDAVVAFVGADMAASVNGQRLPHGRPVRVKAGDVLRFGSARAGCRACLAVAGGFAVPEMLGGRGACPSAGLPGLLGRELKPGDELSIGEPAREAGRHAAGEGAVGNVAGNVAVMEDGRPVPWFVVPPFSLPVAGSTVTIRVLPGPEFDRLSPAAAGLLLERVHMVGNRSNRMGLRLVCDEPIPLPAAGGMVSEAVAWGTVQLPPGGEPIVLGADRQTTGGYPRVLQVIAADLPLLGQLPPGARVLFQPVNHAEAVAALAAAERRMRMLEWAIDRRLGDPG